MKVGNLYYFREICPIGGVETFFYEIAKKYNKKDILIYYDKADEYQLKRLKKLVRCKKRIPGEKIVCDRAYFNYNIDCIDDVESTENYYAFVIHAVYQKLGYTKEELQKITNHQKINHFIAVSNYASEKFYEWTGKKAEVCYNPLTLEEPGKVKIIVSACRLDDSVKGGKATIELIKALDNYTENHPDKHYLWLIFTNTNTRVNVESKNMVIMKPRVDIRPYIKMASFVAQLSDDMETYCYTLNEAWGYGIPTISTPLTVKKELPIPPGADIELAFDYSNADEVARQIFETDIKPFKYDIPEDNWSHIFKDIESKYEEELRMKYKVRALPKYKELNVDDKNLQRIPEPGEEFEVTKERLDVLLGDNGYKEVFVEVVEEIKPEEPKPTTKKKK